MPQTVVEKIADAHCAAGPDRRLRAGDFVSIRPRHILTHDNTAAVLKKFRAMGCTQVLDPRQPVFALDHDIQAKDEVTLKKYREIEAFARAQLIDFYPAGAGIGHQLMVERGYATPGSFVVASDSHANMYGALGAVGTPVVRTDAAVVWATGEFWWQVPPTVQVMLEGQLPPEASGKDVILALCGACPEEVLNCAVEFAGPGVATLSMDARLTIANMTTEWGALVGWFPADEVTERYLEAQARNLGTETWRGKAVLPDADAAYAARITLDLSTVTAHVAGPDAVQLTQPVSVIARQPIAVQKAYLVSCVNSRPEDLAAAARVFEGKKVAPDVKFYVAAASAQVQRQAEANGTWQTLLNAGAIVLPPGCGPCIGLGTGLLEAGETGISATNRNFKGRMGSRDARCYLASPAVVAASAIAGYICSPTAAAPGQLQVSYQKLATPPPAEERVSILPGFPERLRGRLVFLPHDNLNTDGIYGKDYTYREDMTPAMMAKVVMANYDPQFAASVLPGDVLVAGANFGTGSSREQAVTALKAKGIPLVIARSFSQTYLRNAFNNGFLCIEAPELVDLCAERLRDAVRAGQKTIITAQEIAIDFTSGVIEFGGRTARFAPLGSVPQSLIVAGGVENLVSQQLTAATAH